MSCAFEEDAGGRVLLLQPAEAPRVRRWLQLRHPVFSRLRGYGFPDTQRPWLNPPHPGPYVVVSEPPPGSRVCDRLPLPPEWRPQFCLSLGEAAQEANLLGVQDRIFDLDSMWVDSHGRPHAEFPLCSVPLPVSSQLQALLQRAFPGP